MIELPKRSDSIYKEIENFEDYEFTNCIAYEMAIRNKKVKKILSKILLHQYKESNKIDIKKELHEKFFIDSSIIDYVSEKITFIVIRESYIKGVDTDKIKYYYISEFIDKLEFIHEYYYNNEILDDYNHIPLQEHKYHNNSRHPLLNKVLNYKVNQKTPYTIIEIPIFKRPKVYPPDIINYDIDLKVNFNLPKDELIAYISKIKDEYNKDNSIIKTPLELLSVGTDENVLDIKNLPKRDIKKMYATMFYIYDFFTYLDKENTKKKEELKNKLDEEIKAVNRRWDYDKYDKKNRIDTLKDEYKIDKSGYSKEDIKNKLVDELGFNLTKINDNLKIMRTFIDDLEYKKLITSGANLY